MCCGNTPCWPTGNAAPCSARAGDIVWMCAPRWDSDAVFSALLGGPGGYSITPVDRFVWGGYYEEGSMIWRSRWVTNHGIIECREALAFPGDPHRAVLLRRVIAVDGDASGPDHPGPAGRFRPARPHPTCTARTASGPAAAARCTCGGPGHRPAPARSTGTTA